MTIHPADARLSAYLDGELPPEEAVALETHVLECEPCRTLLVELRRVVQRAQALEDRPPRADLWPAVAAAIGVAPARRRRISFSMPQLLAASVALMLVSGATAAWLARSSAASGPTPVPTLGAAPAEPGSSTVTPAGAPSRGYAAAVEELERELARHIDRLDTTTVRVVGEKLAIIDRAIAEAERALATDSSDTYLHSHLAQTRLRKLELLRRAAALTRQVS